MFLLEIVIFQLIIGGLYAQQTCTSVVCQNGGTCFVDSFFVEKCNCTSNWTGTFCDIRSDQIPFIWTLDETCQLNFGRDFMAVRFLYTASLIPFVCNSDISCYSLTFSNYIIGAKAVNGTICGSDSVCYNDQCVRSTRTPAMNNMDETIGNMTCQSYLSRGNSSFGQSFCSNYASSLRCPYSCRKFKMLPSGCVDNNLECKTLSNVCNTTHPVQNVTVRNVCPFSCNNCTGVPLMCSNSSSICLNGGTCQNTTVTPGAKFAFRCVCPTGYSGEICEISNPCVLRPCPTGRRCVQNGNLNRICV